MRSTDTTGAASEARSRKLLRRRADWMRSVGSRGRCGDGRGPRCRIPRRRPVAGSRDERGRSVGASGCGVLLRYTVPAMQFDIVTIFPDFFSGPLDYGIVRRAREAHLVDVRVHDLREYTHDRHRTVDDRPFGGGEGMVLKPEPLFDAVESLLGERVQHGEHREHRENAGDLEVVGARHAVPLHEATRSGRVERPDSNETGIVLLSASGRLFRQDTARRFAQLDRIILLCERYEGVDERVAEHLATDELSIGDFVPSGGELGATLIVDTVTRLLPGALGNEDSSVNQPFTAIGACVSEGAPST